MNTTAYNRARRRSGFTLMELMVSVAILLAILALIGTIFATTSKAGGNATSMAILHRQLAQVAEMIERDLEYVTPGPGGTPLGIRGRVVTAYETAKDRDLARTPPPQHRADTLMFFTTAAQDPYSYQDVTNPLSPFVQVVYQHADLAKLDPRTQQFDLTTLKRFEDLTQPPKLRSPAADWHLARRVIYSLAGLPAGPQPAGTYVGPNTYPVALTNPLFMTGECEVLWYPVAFVKDLFPQPGVLQWHPSYLSSASLGLTAFPDFPGATCFGSYAIYGGNLLALSSADARWWTSGSGNWARQEWTPPSGPMVPGAVANRPPLRTNPILGPFEAILRNTLHDPNAGPSGLPERSVVDPKPALDIVNPMRWNFLPGCSEFKVEYTYDDPRELAMDRTNGQIDLAPRPIRWHSVPDEGEIIWSNVSVSPRNTAGNPAPTDPRRWPRAIRITLRVWDTAGRLADPVTRTIVHTW